MSTPSRIVTEKWQLASMAYAGIVIFLGTLLSGILATIAFSASGCLLSRAIRCFSISRDAPGVTRWGLEIWSLPVLIVALLVVMIGRIRGAVAWWNVLIVSFLAFAILTVKSIDDLSSPEFLALSPILFICVQLALSVGRLAGGLRI